MTNDPEVLETGRKRIGQVFRYLEALNQLRNPVKRRISEEPWILWFRDLPGHPAVRVAALGDSNPQGDSRSTSASPEIPKGNSYVLKVRRPITRPAPTPPPEISEWLRAGWNLIDGQVEVVPTRNETDEQGETVIVRFEDEPQRPVLLARWKERRDQWVVNERPAREALRIFERLYELYGRIEREGERVELVLGDGMLCWRRPEGGISHPILLQRLQLEFDPSIPEFVLTETDHPVELYTALLRTVDDLHFRAISRCREELNQGPFHPLGGDDTSGFLRRLVIQLSPRGELVEAADLRHETDIPRIGRAPVVFMRTRTQGFAGAIESIAEAVKTGSSCRPLYSALLE